VQSSRSGTALGELGLVGCLVDFSISLDAYVTGNPKETHFSSCVVEGV